MCIRDRNKDRVEIRIGDTKSIAVYDLQTVVYLLKSGDNYILVFGDC